MRAGGSPFARLLAGVAVFGSALALGAVIGDRVGLAVVASVVAALAALVAALLTRQQPRLAPLVDPVTAGEGACGEAAKGAGIGLYEWDLTRNHVFYSTAWKQLLGLDVEGIGADPEQWLGRVHPDDRERVEAELRAHLGGHGTHFESEHRMRRADGSWLWVANRARAERSQGSATRLSGAIFDVTERRRTTAKLAHDALHDGLTGLANRALFNDRLEGAITRARRHRDYLWAVLFLDLDQFKSVNDTLGHDVGDDVLVAVARRLEECVREGDTISRQGGDEFALLLDDIESNEDALEVADRIQQRVSAPFPIRGQEVFTSASIGIALSKSGYESPEDALRDADTAMYEAKAMGKARHEVFDTAMHHRETRLLLLEAELGRALEREQLRLVYLPVVELTSGAISGLEALLRWHHPERGEVDQADLIEAAEESGLIVPIGEWVIGEACRQLAEWRTAGIETTVSVNVSARQVGRGDLAAVVERAIETAGAVKGSLKLELPESALLQHPKQTLALLEELKGMETELLVDDFGTGTSSLGVLRTFPVAVVKIDRSFVAEMESGEGKGVVEAVVHMAKSLGLRVVAEGVEHDAQAEALRALGCDAAQGFFFARPLAPAEAATLLRAVLPFAPLR